MNSIKEDIQGSILSMVNKIRKEIEEYRSIVNNIECIITEIEKRNKECDDKHWGELYKKSIIVYNDYREKLEYSIETIDSIREYSVNMYSIEKERLRIISSKYKDKRKRRRKVR